MKINISLVLIIITLYFKLNAQNLKYFSIIPDELSGDDNAGLLAKVVSDSEFIYVMGHYPKEIKNIKKTTHPIIASYDYKGNILNSHLIIDSTISPSIFNNQPIIKKNDSIYFVQFNVTNPFSDPMFRTASFEWFEVNLRSGKIINRKKAFDISKIKEIDINAYSILKDSVFQFILQVYDDYPIQKNYIYEMDLNLNVKKIIPLPNSSQNSYFKWISKENGIYHIIEDVTLRIPTRTGYMNYMKVDSNGTLLKIKRLPTKRNIFIGGVVTYSVSRNNDGTFVIACNEWGPDFTEQQAAPYFIKTSPEFDSIIWMTNFYESENFVDKNEYYFYFTSKMKDKSGYVACGELSSNSNSVPNYGMIFKVSENGDSLWLRKYQPLSWDSLRSQLITFFQINV
ncbi:MAG: hypothetical protein ABIO44_00645, partial [Saprospiraceae bacterium]